MKTSAFSRGIELATLAARVGLKEMRSGNMKSRLDQAILIANSLSNLKGAAMKAGQLLSLDLDAYFPPEAIEILSQLQKSATAQPFSQISVQLRKELGKEKFATLRDLAETPIGVASIGQVHRAKYKGQDIALKIQYEGVADSIDSDLKILKTLASSFCQLTGRRMDLEPLFQEFRRILIQEVDYVSEASLQMEYRSRVAKLGSQNDFSFRVPEVVEDLSTDRVLAMSFEKGESLRSWLSAKPSKDFRQALAISVLDLYFHEFFEWGLVQTDPNWGNFLVDHQKSKHELVLLDFGATRRYTREFVQNYVRLLQLAGAKNSAALREHSIQFGLLDPRESASAHAAFEQLMQTAIRPFFSKSSGSSHFDFSDPGHALNSQMAAKTLAEELVYSPPPYSLVFLHRKLAGVYSILKSLEARIDVSEYWENMLEYSKS
jgi:aarF domain-containing kinase